MNKNEEYSPFFLKKIYIYEKGNWDGDGNYVRPEAGSDTSDLVQHQNQSTNLYV